MGRYVSNAGVPATRSARPDRERSQGRQRSSESAESSDSGESASTDADFSQRIVGQARKLFDDEIGARLGRSASDLNRLSDALRGAGSRLEGSFAGPYFERAAGQLEHVAQLLQHTNSRDMVEGVQRMARERPLLFLGSAVALGIGAGRFLKSSATPLLAGGVEAAASDTEAEPTSARRSTRNRNREASQTRGTSHE